jgi:hypothetical protein
LLLIAANSNNDELLSNDVIIEESNMGETELIEPIPIPIPIFGL